MLLVLPVLPVLLVLQQHQDRQAPLLMQLTQMMEVASWKGPRFVDRAAQLELAQILLRQTEAKTRRWRRRGARPSRGLSR